MTDTTTPREALAKRLACSDNSILRLSGRGMPMRLSAAERDLIAEALRQETAPVPAASRAIELSYGLLWHCSSDRRSGDGLAMQVARQALLYQLNRDGQARGIAAARAAIERSRTLSRTAPDIIAKVLEAQDEPKSD
jgi:hypothetical protein